MIRKRESYFWPFLLCGIYISVNGSSISDVKRRKSLMKVGPGMSHIFKNLPNLYFVPFL